MGAVYNTVAQQQFCHLLSGMQQSTVLFPQSQARPNPDLVDGAEAYAAALPEYIHRPEQRDKVSFWPDTYRFEGHKLHLNVPAAHVLAVATHLKDQNYLHKYIGYHDVGKIFTVYLGAKDLAFETASILSESLKAYLAQPVNWDDVEYAPNVGGRFDGFRGLKGFYPYGNRIRGLPLHQSCRRTYYIPSSIFEKPQIPDADGLSPTKNVRDDFERSFEMASQRYGTYFYGGGYPKPNLA